MNLRFDDARDTAGAQMLDDRGRGRAAAAIDLAGAWLAHPPSGRRLHSKEVPFDAEHVIERCRIFLVIALGKTVLGTGTAIAEHPASPTMVTGATALVSSAMLCAIGFGRVRHALRDGCSVGDRCRLGSEESQGQFPAVIRTPANSPINHGTRVPLIRCMAA